MATTEATSTVRRSSRKKSLVFSTQEEENDAGFRFTRQSKRSRMNEVQGKEDKQNESTKKSKTTELKTIEKKKRRSSFIRGRKPRLSLELVESDRLDVIKGLHKDIPAELNSKERLLLLFDKSLQLMSERMKDEKNEKLPDFAEEAEEFVANLQTTIKSTLLSKEKESQQQKSCERIVIPNPKNEQLEEYAKQSQEIRKRMLCEDKAWEEIYHKYEDESESSERQTEDENSDKLDLDDLSSEQNEFFSSELPLDEIMDRTNDMKLKSLLMMAELSKFTEIVNASSDKSEGYIDKSFKSLGVSLKRLADTPHKLILGTLGNKDKLDV